MSFSKSVKQFADDDLIQCGICHIDIEHRRSLVCLHTYCLACLREWSKNSKDEVTCPICREPTPLPANGVDGLRSNFFVTKLKDRKAVSRQLMDKDVKIMCTSCDSGNEAVARCLDCDDFLCETCFKAHQNMRLMKHHSVLTLVELRSGEVHLTQQTYKEDYCTEHRGQVFWFFCKTCDVPICRDCTVVEHPTSTHDVVKLESVVTDHKDEIRQLMSSCKIVKQDVDEALEKTQSLRSDLDEACNNASKGIQDTKDEVSNSFLTRLEQQEADLLKSIKELKTTKEKSLSGYENELQMLQSRLNTALEMAAQVSNEGSNCDVAAAYKPLTTTLKQLGKMRNPTFDMGKIVFMKENFMTSSASFIGRIETTVVKQALSKWLFRNRNKVQWNAIWKMVSKFGDSGDGKLKDAKGVALNNDGDIAVADCDSQRVYIYNIDNGKMKMAIDTNKSLHSNPSSFKSFAHDVAICKEKYIVTDQTYFPTVYDNSGNCVDQLSVTNHKEACTMGLAVNSKEQIFVGHYSGKHLGLYNVSDVKLVSSINSPVSARYIALSSDDDKIIISANNSDGAHVINTKGQTIHVLGPPTSVKSSWRPSGVCTIGEGDDEEIFICNGSSVSSPGVYRYSLTTGKYLGCVTTDVSSPQGISFIDNGRLVVADKTCVKVFAPSEK